MNLEDNIKKENIKLHNIKTENSSLKQTINVLEKEIQKKKTE